jgi:outer membrane autotransporter protein
MNFDVNRLKIEPTVGLTLMTVSSGPLSETNNSRLSENIGGINVTSLQSFAGVRLATVANLTPRVPMTLRGIVGWSHEMSDVAARVPASFAALGGTGVFSTTTAPIRRDAARLSAGFGVNLTTNVSR